MEGKKEIPAAREGSRDLFLWCINICVTFFGGPDQRTTPSLKMEISLRSCCSARVLSPLATFRT